MPRLPHPVRIPRQRENKIFSLTGDDRPRQENYVLLRIVELHYLLNLMEIVTAKTVAQAKSSVSPFFGAKELAFAYALA